MPRPSKGEMAAKSAPPAALRPQNVEGSVDVNKQDPATTPTVDNSPAVKTSNKQQPSLTGLAFILLLFSIFLAILQIALNATITSTVCSPLNRRTL